VWQRTATGPALFDGTERDIVLAEPYVTNGLPDLATDRPLEGIDARTGATLWRIVTPVGTLRNIAPYPTWEGRAAHLAIVELAADGTFDLRSDVNGAVLRTARLDSPGPVEGLSIAGDRVIAYAPSGTEGRQTGVTVFDLGTGRRVWQRRESAPGDPSSSGGSAWWCGISLLCDSNGTSTTAIDLATGTERWRSVDGGDLYAAGDRWLIGISNHVTDQGQMIGDAAVVDARTGRMAVSLPDWQILDARQWPRLIAIRVTSPGIGVLAAIDGRTGRQEVFGRLDSFYGFANCEVTLDVVICRTGPLHVWRRRK
jgi:hypothetical protein